MCGPFFAAPGVDETRVGRIWTPPLAQLVLMADRTTRTHIRLHCWGPSSPSLDGSFAPVLPIGTSTRRAPSPYSTFALADLIRCHRVLRCLVGFQGISTPTWCPLAPVESLDSLRFSGCPESSGVSRILRRVHSRRLAAKVLRAGLLAPQSTPVRQQAQAQPFAAFLAVFAKKRDLQRQCAFHTRPHGKDRTASRIKRRTAVIDFQRAFGREIRTRRAVGIPSTQESLRHLDRGGFRRSG